MSKNSVLILFLATIATFTMALVHLFQKTKGQHEDRVQAITVVVHAPSSFIDPYGPGAEIKALFEKSCDCTVQYVDVGSANMAIERLRMDPTRRADVLLGLDLLRLPRAIQTVKLQTLKRPTIPWRKEINPFVYQKFLPYDWSPMGLIYRKSETQPFSTWKEGLLKLPPRSLALQDPILSSPGLEFVFWLYNLSPSLGDTLKSLKPLVHSYSPSWSEAYGLFKKKQARVAFSYLTSLLYHWREEHNEDYQFMVFPDGHPVQIEYAAVPDSCWSCEPGKRFLEFLLTPQAQEILANKNYMLSVRSDVTPALSERLPDVNVLGPQRLDEFLSKEAELLQIWKAAH